MDLILGHDFDLMTFNILVHRLLHDQTMYQILEKPKDMQQNSPEAFFMHGLARTHFEAYIPFLDPLAEFKLLTQSVLDPPHLDSCFRHSSPAH